MSIFARTMRRHAAFRQSAPVNLGPTGVTFANATTSLPEDTDTTSPIKLADVVVADDLLGTNTLSLTGDSRFALVGSELFLAAGASLDYETATSHSCTVTATDDEGAGSASGTFTLAITDVSEASAPDAPTGVGVTVIDNEGPTAIQLSNQTTSLPEDTDTTSRTLLANITVTDDGMGTNVLSVDNPSYFEIYQGSLYLVAGASLDYETATSHSCTISATDSSTNDPPATIGFTLSVTDVVELTPPDAPTGVAVAVSEMPATTDPYFSNVSLLLQDSLTDESLQGQTVVAANGASFTTTNPKFGTHSLDIVSAGHITTSAFPFGTGDYTLEMWFYQTASAFQPFLYAGHPHTASGSLWVAADVGGGGGLTVGVAGGGAAQQIKSQVVPALNQWNHFAVCRESGTTKIFLNGNLLISSAAHSGVNLLEAAPEFGNESNSNRRFPGYLDEIRVTVGIARYNANFTPPTAAFPTSAPPPTEDEFFYDTVLLLQDSLTDESPAGRTITYNGTAGLSTDSKVGTHAISSPAGNSNYVSMASSTDFGFGSGDFTLECWFKYPNAINVAADLIMLFDFRPAGSVYSYPVPALYINSAELIYYVSGGKRISATKPSANTWHHVAVCRISGTTEMFLNGVSQGTWADSTNYTSPSVLRLGRNESGSASGAMLVDSVRVTKGVGRYATSFTPPTAAFPAAGPVDDSFSDVALLLRDSTADESLQGQTITATGTAGTSTAQSKFGGTAFVSDGQSNLVTAANDPAFALPADFTIESWIYFDTYSATEQFWIWRPVNNSASGSSTNRLQFLVLNDTLYTDRYGTVLAQSGSLGLTAGQWYHVAACRSGTTLRLFLDGTQVASSTTATAFNSDEHRLPCSYTTARTMFFDDFRLTVGTARYTASFTPPTATHPATNGDIRFGSVSLLLQDSFIDESPQGRTVVINGNTQIDTSVKKYGTGSISMQAAGDTLQTTVDSSLDFSGQFTVEAWVRTTTSNNFRTLWGHRRSATSGTDIFVLFFDSSTTLKAGILSDQFAVNATSILDGDWHHVAMVRDATHLRLYLDGVQGGSTPSSATLSAIGLPFYIGTDEYYSSRQFLGHMDDIRITNGVARYPNGTTFTPPTQAFPN